MKFLKIIMLSLMLIFASTNAKAALIDIYVGQGGISSEHLYFDSFLDIMEFISDGDSYNSLADKFTNYKLDVNKGADLVINYRGVPIVLSTTDNGTGLTGAKLTVGDTVLANVTGSGIDALIQGISDELFGGADLSSSDIDYALVTDLLKKINEIAVKQTPFDPIAGNPTSFLYRNLDYSYNSIMYDYAFRPTYTRHSLKDLYGKKKTVQSLTIPLGFDINFTDKTRLAFNTNLSASDYDGALSGDVSFGTTAVIGVFDNYGFDVRIAAGLRAGVAGSLDFATVAPMWNAHGGLLTKYQTPIKELELVMLNDFGYYKIPQINLEAFMDDLNLTIPYDLSAIGAKNGITANYYFTPDFYATFSVIDTRFFKYEQYISFYEEFRLGLELDRDEKYFIDNLAFFFAYKIGEKDYSALEVGFGLSF